MNALEIDNILLRDNVFKFNNYRLIDALKSDYHIIGNEEDINSFIIENNNDLPYELSFNQNGFMNILFDIVNQVHLFIPNYKSLSLELLEGDFFHNNILGIVIKVDEFIPNFSDLEDVLYDRYDSYDLDKIHLTLEF